VGGVLLEGGGSPAGGASIARLRDGFLEECRVSPGELIDVQQGRRDQEVVFTSSYDWLLHVSFECLTMVVGLTRMGNWATRTKSQEQCDADEVRCPIR
jgi:hypothetical protein